jgi:hypothetical protein
MQDESSNVLTSPGFLAALLLLLLNDFFLKTLFHNSFTGKLSDFAGLFAFPLFWTAFLPRFRSRIYLATAGLFILWKSPASTTLIDGWNSLGVFSISRVIDYTDLFALAILPPSYLYGLKRTGVRAVRAAPALIALIAIFAFTATSYRDTTKHGKEFYVAMPRRDLLERMSQFSKRAVSSGFWEADEFIVSIESCIEADFSIEEKDHRSVLTLKETHFRCPWPPSKEEILGTFEREFVAKLAESPGATPTKIRWVEGKLKFPSPSPSQSAPKSRRGSG